MKHIKHICFYIIISIFILNTFPVNTYGINEKKEDKEVLVIYSDNENLSLMINVYCPFEEWLIVGDTLRPFAIMSEIRKSIQDKRINGLGEIKYSGFSVSTLTEEMGCYVMGFEINAFS